MAQRFNIVAQLQLKGPPNLRSIVRDMQRQLGNVNVNVNVKVPRQASAQAQSLAKNIQAVSNSATKATKTVKQLASGTSSAGAAAKGAAKNFQQAATSAQAFGQQSALAVKRFMAFTVGAGIIYGLANAMKTGVKSFIDFEREMIKVSQVTGKTMQGLSDLRKKITSSELVNVSRVLSQTGLAARDVRVALKALAQSSLAPTFKDMTNTAEGAIAIMRQFGVTADKLGAKLGSINALAGQFAVESQDLIFAIRRAGGAFKAAGGSLEELLALFTSVRATTRESAETIATGFRTIFTRIQRPKTIEFLRQAGIELQNLEGNFVGPFEAIKRLNRALKTLDSRDPRFSQIVEELGGFRQVSKVIPLIQQFATAQRALAVAQKGTGSLAKDAAKAQASLAVQIQKVREEFYALFRSIGESSTFQGFAKMALQMASSFIKLADAIKPVLPLLAGIAALQGMRLGSQFASGFAGGFGGGGAKAAGQGMGQAATGRGGSQQTAATQKATQAQVQANQIVKQLSTSIQKANTQIVSSIQKHVAALGPNTQALTKLTAAITNLATKSTFGAAGMMGGRRGPRKFATGGLVPGTGSGDTVPALLEPGEFVIKKSSVAKAGAGNLARMVGGGLSFAARKANKLKRHSLLVNLKT